MESVKNFLVSVQLNSSNDGVYSAKVLDGSDFSLKSTHIVRIHYYHVGEFIYYYVVSVLDNKLDEFIPFKSLTLSTEYSYSSDSVDKALDALGLSSFNPASHCLMSCVHKYISDSFNRRLR